MTLTRLPKEGVSRATIVGALSGCGVLALLAVLAGWRAIRADAGEGLEWFMTMTYLAGAPWSLAVSHLPRVIVDQIPLISFTVILIGLPLNGAAAGLAYGVIATLASRLAPD